MDQQDPYVARAKTRVENHLKHSRIVRKVEVVTGEDQLAPFEVGGTDAILCVHTIPLEDMEILETPSDVHHHIADQAFEVDAIIVKSDFPPAHIVRKGAIFYLKVAL